VTGYLYGSLFFTPIDVPFLAAMTWATLAIIVVTRQVLPSWRMTVVAGVLTGLALGTRTTATCSAPCGAQGRRRCLQVRDGT